MVRDMNFKIQEADHITMTYTGLLPGKKGSVVHLCFNRKKKNGEDFTEIVMPECKVLHNQGFSAEELEQLRIYAKANKTDILEAAKKINHDLVFHL